MTLVGSRLGSFSPGHLDPILAGIKSWHQC